MDQAVDDGVCYHRIAEDLAPFGERLVGRHHDRAPLVPRGDKLEEEVSHLPVHREVAYLVDDEEAVLAHVLDRLFLPSLGGGLPQPLYEAPECDEVCGHVARGGLYPDRGRQVRLADPRRADEHHVLRLLEEAERPQVHDPRPVDGRLVREVEVVNDVIIITIYDDLKTANCGKN